MSLSETLAIPNVLYLILMGGLWLTALALASPGTGLLELAAAAALILAGLGTLVVPLNPWGLAVIVLGAVLFVVGLRARRTRLWLGLSALSLSLGSAFLFGLSAGEPAVHPLLALVVSVLTVAFFGWSIQRAVIAQRERPRHDPSSILGLVGEVRTTLDPTGSVYVGGELWSARSDAVLPVGTSVRVTAREGLLLLVEPVRHDAVSRSTQGGS